ncbi:MAG: class I SAM-dependent methyltransferase [Lachnospiraceae bacterium]|nr:class I SAM-dependent methyltransferase [Lachnospiraceae bacterium]
MQERIWERMAEGSETGTGAAGTGAAGTGAAGIGGKADAVGNADIVGKADAVGDADAAGTVRVLNLFAYTGGATLACAAAGARVTHVDASKGMVQWAKENARISELPKDACRWLVDDCIKFVEREIRRGNHYDGIIMDPPSYGRGPKGEIWKLEDEIYSFLTLTEELLSDKPLFFLLNSYTTGLQSSVLSYLLNVTIRDKRGGRTEADEIGLPVQGREHRSSGEDISLILPCGASGRWVPEA